MRYRYNQRRHERGLEEKSRSARPGYSERPALQGENFWYSVWKRIEGSQPGQPNAGGIEVASRMPLDYVVETEARA